MGVEEPKKKEGMKREDNETLKPYLYYQLVG
jgi:hypothetical protein